MGAVGSQDLIYVTIGGLLFPAVTVFKFGQKQGARRKDEDWQRHGGPPDE
jgi:hypothetical protein